MFGQLFSRDPSAARAGFRTTSFLGRCIPVPGASIAVPRGYVTLQAAPALAAENAGNWGLPLDWQHILLRRKIAALIGEAAATGQIDLPAIEADTGQAIWMPAAAWRMTLVYSDRTMSPAEAATRGRLIRLPAPIGITCAPMISEHDLALVLRASDPPLPPPFEVLETIRAFTPSAAPHNRADGGDRASHSGSDDGSATWDTGMHELDPWDHHDPFDGSEQVNPFSEASADSDSEDIGDTPDEAEAADRVGYPPEAGGTQPEHPPAELRPAASVERVRPRHRGMAWLYIPEARRRIAANEQCPTAPLEARYLRKWMDKQEGGPFVSEVEAIRRNLVDRHWPELPPED